MNIKKIGLAVICSGAFITSCGNLNTGYEVVGYDDAVKFIKQSFGEGTDEPKYHMPNSVECEWKFGGVMEDWGRSPENVLNPEAELHYLPTHMSSFINRYTGLPAKDIFATYKYDVNFGNEFSFNSNGVKKISGDKFTGYLYPILDGKHFDNNNVDDLVRYFFSNASKYSARYTINYHNKAFKINGTYYGVRESEHKGNDILVMPGLQLDFNTNGTIKSVKWEFEFDQLCSYTWLTEYTKTSDRFSWNMYQGSFISINFNY